MTTKDYKLIAQVIHKLDTAREHTGYLEVDSLIEELSKMFLNDNPRFEEVKFKVSCYYGIDYKLESVAKDTCLKLNSCEKINMILDKDMLDFQYIDSMKSVCAKCKEGVKCEK